MKRLLKRSMGFGAGGLVMLLFSAGICHGQGALGIIAAETSTDLPLKGVQTESLIQEQDLPNTEMPLGDSSKYTLGINDVIKIDVLRHPEVSGEYIINNEGKIQYEFVGDVKIIGLTKDEVSDNLIELLSKYVIDPEVTVKITGYNSKVVYVIGEVGNPGKIYMRGDTITVREALVQAGLPTLGASTRKCRLITPADKGNAQTKYVNVFSLIYEGDLRENIVMKPGDTLYIPATIMTKAMRVIAPIAQPVTTAAGAGSTVMTGF
ncbi:MAG: polysaccharide biosynthesis/export family protein [Candidatus Omnitrophota bacterium]